MDILIRALNLKKNYKIGKIVIPALNGVSFEVSKGEFLAINGRSGSGKSTLLNLLGLLDEPTEGELIMDGHEMVKFSEKEKTKFRLQSIGFVFQFFNLIENYTAIENITFQLKLQGLGNSESKRRAEDIIEFLGLKDRAYFFPREMSGGEQQRVAIGRAIAKESLLILVDEPTAHLDDKNSQIIINLLGEINRKFGRTIVLVTYEEKEASEADRIITLQDGRIIKNEKNISNSHKTKLIV